MSRWRLAQDPLVTALDAAAASAADKLARLEIDSRSLAHDGPLLEALAIHDASKQLVETLSNTEPFVSGAGFLVARPNGYVGFHADEAARVLVKRVLGGHPPASSLDWLARVLQTPEASGLAVTAVWGLVCLEPVDLTHGIRLLPVHMLPETETRSRLLRPSDPTTAPIGTSPFWEPPSAALVVPATISPLLHRAVDGPPPSQPDPFRLHTILDDARLVLSLIGPSHPLPAGHWFELDDPDLRQAFGADGVSFQHIEVLPWGFEPPQDIDPGQARELVRHFFETPEDVRSTLRLSLQRFNQAMRRPPHGDRALDLAIALESLLVDGPGENTYKIALRGALLLAGPPEARLQTRALLSSLYALRSTLVHDGVLPKVIKVPGVGRRPSVDVVREASVVARTILAKIIERRHVPDWYSFELGL